MKPFFILVLVVMVVLAGAWYVFFAEPRRDCEQAGQGQAQCWLDAVEQALQKKGVGAAFDIVELIYQTQPNCHDYAHRIGEEAYRLFSQGKDLEISPKTYYCGYGFYHAFMETLLQTTGNIEQAREFCAYADKQLSQRAAGTQAACYHGIGHGAVDGGDQRDWGNIEAMIEPGIKLCEFVAETEFQRYICATGVFNAIDILSLDPKYKLDIVEKDPFWLCDRQPPRYKEACYTNMVPALMRAMQGDFPRMASRIESIQEQGNEYSLAKLEAAPLADKNYSIRFIVMSALFHEYARADLARARESILVCRSLQDPRSRLPCIEGLSGAFMKYGEPNAEYVKGMQFCASAMLLEDEKEACHKHILSRLRLWYEKDKAGQVCQNSPERFQAFCPTY